MARELEQEVRGFIVENFLFGQVDNGLQDSDSLLERGIIDSTGVLEIVSFLEENYEIQVEDEELIPENLDSINNVIEYISKKRGKISA